MKTLRLILADQLTHSIASLDGADKANDIIMLCEVMAEATYVKHHPKKIAFLFSAMRHFAQELQEKGYVVRYITLDHPENTKTFLGEIKRAINECGCNRIILTEPGEYRVLKTFQSLESIAGVPVDIKTDTRFLSSVNDFKKWAQDKKQLRMEFFYRDMRKRYCILMDGDNPVGGAWNYDKENRKTPKGKLNIPKRMSHKKSAITQTVLALVKTCFSDHFGDLEPFHFAVTRAEALKELQHFIDHILPFFGDYQDAMVTGEPYLYHSLISSYLNAGLLLPLEICQMAEQAYHNKKAPLNAVEGFIRQILGWREYVRGIYWLHMPRYADMNFFNADQPLPAFYWGAKTHMACVAEAVKHTREHAYSHHIQRLMVTGNFALLAGLNVEEVCAWYLAVYADAYEWVELPNTLGMALYADNGIMASKPYAASGKYIDKMSNYCEGCIYDPDIAVGDKACPFNALYWDFFARNEQLLRGNPRIPYTYATWDKMKPEKQKELRHQAALTLQKMSDGTL
jgi:deoxyribodipyrimidine photolyase-related protein